MNTWSSKRKGQMTVHFDRGRNEPWWRSSDGTCPKRRRGASHLLFPLTCAPVTPHGPLVTINPPFALLDATIYFYFCLYMLRWKNGKGWACVLRRDVHYLCSVGVAVKKFERLVYGGNMYYNRIHSLIHRAFIKNK